ncbi:beta-propeller domain-containing protein [Gemmata sp.]|uniref:beta-propeller domain-containing protein n=1 Tax=Gemmata sp. TaxID=1914242 RepID=UPI003F703F68
MTRPLILAACCVYFAAALAAADEPKPVRHALVGVAFATSGRAFVVDADGKVTWEYPVKAALDVWLLPNGNLLFPSRGVGIIEVNKDKEVVWQYKMDAATETYSCQRLADGTTVIGDNNNRRIIEVDKDGKVLRETKVKSHGHYGLRSVRKLESGNYLVCERGAGAVREYTPEGKVAFEYKVGGPLSAVRLPNGNTLINTAIKGLCVEVNPKGEEVWKVTRDDVPADLRPQGQGRGSGVQRLPNGNTVACFEGAIYEFTPEKKIVWHLKDGPVKGMMNFQITDVPGDPTKGEVLR